MLYIVPKNELIFGNVTISMFIVTKIDSTFQKKHYLCTDYFIRGIIIFTT